MDKVWIAIAVLGSMGLLFGLVLAIASKVFYVKTDPRLEQPENRGVLRKVRRMFADTPDIFN